MPRPRRKVRRFARRQTRRHMHRPPHGLRPRRGGPRGHMGRPALHRRRRIIRHGSAAILLLAGARAAVKLRNEDLSRIQQFTGKPAEEMTDQELLDSMERLGIKSLDLEPSDRETMKLPKLAPECPACGYPLTVESAYWVGPMSAKCPACNVGLEISWVEVEVPNR